MSDDSVSARGAHVERSTLETSVEVGILLSGSGGDIATGVGFLDHMLAQIGRHGGIGLTVRAAGENHVDDHHTVEDVGIVLGMALRDALGDRTGIVRYGAATVPMDEALVTGVVDISGRGMACIEMPIPDRRIGTFASELVPEFFRALACNAGWTVHLRLLAGHNSHHIVEAGFKAFARAAGQAMALSGNPASVASTKGVL